MNWTCPVCFRTFKTTHQSHSCRVVPLESHFSGKNPEIFKIYQRLEGLFFPSDDVRISSVKNAILFAADSTFLAVKPKKERIDIEFVLDREMDEFPVYKTVRISKTKVAHFLKLESADEIDRQVTGWLRSALQISSTQKH